MPPTTSLDKGLIVISAMFENGGNLTQRFLDGHPELIVYPFEAQFGNAHWQDQRSSLYPFRYRYPEFSTDGELLDDYESFHDEELKTLIRAPKRSKFRNVDFDFDEGRRRLLFLERAGSQPRRRGALVAAYLEATSGAWRNRRASDRENAYVAFCPMIAFDAERIFADFPQAHIVHVVRDPIAAYADSRQRPFPMTATAYGWLWAALQHHALVCARRYPERFHILRFEDIAADPPQALGRLTERLGLPWDEALSAPSWNGQPLSETGGGWGVVAPSGAGSAALDPQARGVIAAHAAIVGPLLGYHHDL